MTCARTADLDFVERYVLGQMDEAEQASFEAHYFECPDCFAAVQALQTAQSVLREAPAPEAAVPQPASPPSRVVDFNTHPARTKNGDTGGTGRSPSTRLLASGAVWIGLAAAASLAGVMVWSPWRAHGPETPEPGAVVATNTPPTPVPVPSTPTPNPTTLTGQPSGTGTATSPTSTQPTQTAPAQTNPAQTNPAQATPTQAPTRSPITLDALALVTPPVFVAMQTRGPGDGGSDAAFTAAMTKYSAKDYQGAATALKPIVDARPDATYAAFYLGVSYLAAGESSDASAVLNRVAASNVAPYADEAHFYLAKTALRAHDLDRAERELSLAIERQAGPPNEAAKLLQAVRAYRRDHAQN